MELENKKYKNKVKGKKKNKENEALIHSSLSHSFVLLLLPILRTTIVLYSQSDNLLVCSLTSLSRFQSTERLRVLSLSLSLSSYIFPSLPFIHSLPSPYWHFALALAVSTNSIPISLPYCAHTTHPTLSVLSIFFALFPPTRFSLLSSTGPTRIKYHTYTTPPFFAFFFFSFLFFLFATFISTFSFCIHPLVLVSSPLFDDFSSLHPSLPHHTHSHSFHRKNKQPTSEQ